MLREDISKYLMAAALHDVGMGVSARDLEGFIDAAGIRTHVRVHPEMSGPTLIRKFYHDFPQPLPRTCSRFHDTMRSVLCFLQSMRFSFMPIPIALKLPRVL